MLKRPAEPVDSPGLGIKRRCLEFRSGGSPIFGKATNTAQAFDENTVHNALHHHHKRARTDSYASPSSSKDVPDMWKQRYEIQIACLKTEFAHMKQEAEKKIEEVEHTNELLRDTIGKQNMEMERVKSENKILKTGIRALNKQREEALSQQRHTEMLVNDQNRKISQLEQALYTLKMHIGTLPCGVSVRDPSWGGSGGPVY